MINFVKIMSRIANCLEKVRGTLIDKLGGIEESGQFGDYWHTVEYAGPFRGEYDGKFCYTSSPEDLTHDAELLLPFVRKNKIIGFKYRTSENKPDDPFYGQSPAMLVYTTNKRKERVLEILKSIGITNPTWIDDSSYLKPSEVSLVEEGMDRESASSPYMVKGFS